MNPTHSNKVSTLNSSEYKSGKITIITGPMYSGKSTTLLRYIDRSISIGQQTVILSPLIDTRSDCELVCHSGQRRGVVKLKTLMSFFSDPTVGEYDIIGIDEAQFFDACDLYDFASKVADVLHKTIIVSGLDTNFKREEFGGVIRTIAIADEVVKLTALCCVCRNGMPAIFTKRIYSTSSDILVGGKEAYQSVCRHHYHI